MTQPFAQALDELLSARGISAGALARQVGVDAAQVGRWRKGNGLPRPDNIVRVANALGVDYDWLMALAYPETRSPELVPPDVIETAVRARMEEMHAAVRDTPREFWPLIIKATFDRAIESARDMAHLLSLGASSINGSPTPEVNNADEAVIGADSAVGSPLRPRHLAPALGR